MTRRVLTSGIRGALPFAALVLLSFMLWPMAGLAADGPVGRVIVAKGDVTAVRAGQSARSLDRGDPVYEGDEVRTGLRATAQLRFTDGGLFALKPDTRFAVDTYESDDQGGGSALMRFLRGALRTITGSIGQRADDTYRLDTPTATIGVRGTAYALHYCDADCAGRHGGEPGLYGRVGDGDVIVSTPRGTARFGAGTYFFVPEGGAPRTILQPPEGILDDAQDTTDTDAEPAQRRTEVTVARIREPAIIADARATTTEPVFEASDRFETAPATLAGGAGIAAGGSGPFSGFELFPAGGDFTTDGAGNVDSVSFSNGTSVQVTGAALAESGTEAGLGVSWGRWSGGFNVNGTAQSGNLAFATSDNFTAPTNLAALSGSLTYTNPVGPQAFDTGGALWNVDALSLGVDFSSVDIALNQFDLSPVVPGPGLSFINADVIGASVNLDLAQNGLALSVANIDGGAALIGRFVGGAAEGMVILFEANQIPSGATINGVQILRSQ